MGILSNTEPREVFHYFEEICEIPHGSSNTTKISNYLVKFAQNHNLRFLQDASDNVIIFKDGTDGRESRPPVMLQGHMDMVCEKEDGYDIDFEKSGLSLELNDGIITAKGTTLGGDDGIAVAYMLALLASNQITHPPLEAVFTADEEIGMLGAAALDCTPLHARTMLNIDSEEEGYLLASCAGGATVTVHLPITVSECTGNVASLKIDGLQGGHSGIEIDKGRANACTLLGRTLYELKKNYSFQMIQVTGGLKDNAIPREASCTFLLAQDTDIAKLQDAVHRIQDIYRTEYQSVDSNITLTLSCDKTGEVVSAMNKESSLNIITALMNLPNGIQKMSCDIEGLVQTSLNLGIMATGQNEVSLTYSVRSSMSTEKEALVDKLSCLTEHLGGFITKSGDYPAWEYRKESPLRNLMIEIFEKQYGKKPVIQAVHAGVECGLFAGKMPGLDCISFGPDMKDIHTPKESMDVASVQRTWLYLLEILKRI